MERIWDHLENLVPVIILIAVVLLLYGPNLASIDAETIEILTMPGPSIVIGVFLLAFAYSLGFANSSISRFLFTAMGIMDTIRWRYFKNLLVYNEKLRELTRSVNSDLPAHILDEYLYLEGQDTSQDEQTSSDQLESKLKIRKWRIKRKIFHSLVGVAYRVKEVGDEISHRRIEARLLRASILPSLVLAIVITTRNLTGNDALPIVISWSLFVVICFGYYYRECTIADTLGVFSSRIINAPLVVDEG